MNNLHWAIISSDLRVKQPTGGFVYHEVCDIQVKHQTTEEEAIGRAKKILKRKYYFVRCVLECDCAKHSLDHRLTLENSKELVKALKKTLPSDE